MLQMSTEWLWYSQACATSGIRPSPEMGFCIKQWVRWTLALAAVMLILYVLIPATQASVIEAGGDIQAAINSASSGDTILVYSGTFSSFQVDRPVTILGEGEPFISAALQKPAIEVKSDGVTISGFRIRGMGKDTNAKFEYYMQNPAAAAGASLDDPNIAVMVKGDGFCMKNTTIYGAQVGISAENVKGISLQNVTLDACDTGASLLQSQGINVSGCHMSGCKKYGLDVEGSSDVFVNNSSFVNNSNAGLLLKKSSSSVISDNTFSESTFGLSLWNSSGNDVKDNYVDHNYYGILVTDSSNYNNITDNIAEDNSNSDFATGFGIGISLQENSSYNMLTGNEASGNYNGLEVSRGCHHNAVYGNNATDNKHGIRLNENRNNLIFGNNFIQNDINAYENTSLNIWNTTIGNYYSDYQGSDSNGDGIGDTPYPLPGPESESMDMKPLVSPHGGQSLDVAQISANVAKYAIYSPAVENAPTVSMQNGMAVISSKASSSPPKWDDSDSLDVSAPPFQKENSFLNDD